MGGDQIFSTLKEHLGVGHDETTDDGKVTLEHLECNAACDYAPVMMVNWEFFDNQTPESAIALVDDLRAGDDAHADPRCVAVHVQAGLPGAGRVPRRPCRRGPLGRAGDPCRARDPPPRSSERGRRRDAPSRAIGQAPAQKADS